MSFTEETRRSSYEKTLESLGEKKLQIIKILKGYPQGATAWELSEVLNKPVYQTRPRLTELRKLGILTVIAKKYYAPTDRDEAVWMFVEPREQHWDKNQSLLFQGND